MTTESNRPTTPTPAQGQQKSSGQSAPGTQRQEHGADRKNETTPSAGNNPTSGDRSSGQKGSDQKSSDQKGMDSNRTQKAGAAEAPPFGDRPAQPRGGMKDEEKSDSSRTGSDRPGFGDKEPTDPRHTDTEGGQGGRTSSNDRSPRS